MSGPQALPAWASTAVGELLCGRRQDAVVLASTRVASYMSVPEPGPSAPVIALLTQDAVRLPIGVTVAAGKLPENGSVVRIGDGSIASREHTWRPVRWWDPRPSLVAEDLLQRGPELVELLGDQPHCSFGLPLVHELAIAGALAQGDVDPALGVIGLGPGLTPAADDVVAGALAVLALCGGLQDQDRDALAAHASIRTTALSAALIVAAGRGQVIPQAAAVLAALAAGGSPAQLRFAAVALFNVGATSGHDLCAGMAGVLAGLASAGVARSIGEAATITRSLQ
jgi:hypothetical protein